MTTCAENYVYFKPKTNKLVNDYGLGRYITCAVCGKTFHVPTGSAPYRVKGKAVCGWRCKRESEGKKWGLRN